MDKLTKKLKIAGVYGLTTDELLEVTGLTANDYNKFVDSVNEKTEEYKFTNKKLNKALCLGELYRRATSKNYKIRCTSDAIPYFKDIENKEQEHFVLLTLNGANEVINKHTISIGLVNKTVVHPREVYHKAIEDNAVSILVGHNHPTGGLEPSTEDIFVTEKLVESGNILGIKLLDHIIVNRNGYQSCINPI